MIYKFRTQEKDNNNVTKFDTSYDPGNYIQQSWPHVGTAGAEAGSQKTIVEACLKFPLLLA